MDIRKIKNLIFDFGGVLVELDKARCLEAFNRLGFAEAEKLIDELLTLENPYACPHGRPTIISMSRTELEKKFRRIV